MTQAIYPFLLLSMGVLWTIVYIDAIRIGFRDKTYCMPLFALALNIAWEGLYSFAELFVFQNMEPIYASKIVWFALDVLLLATYFKYGKSECETELERKWFIPWSIIVLATCLAVQVLFLVKLGDDDGNTYSSILQNLVMSVCFLAFLRRRKSTRGQSMLIAVCKCAGTLAATLAIGILDADYFTLGIGVLCLVFDLLYIYFLRIVKAKEAGSAEQQAVE